MYRMNTVPLILAVVICCSLVVEGGGVDSYEYVTTYVNNSRGGGGFSRLVNGDGGGGYGHLNVIDHASRGSQGPIVFPGTFNFNNDKERSSNDPRETKLTKTNRKAPPLSLLRSLSSQPDFGKVVESLVKNVRLVTDNKTGEQVLVSTDGIPQYDSRGNKIVLAGAVPTNRSTQIFTVPPPGKDGQGGGSSGAIKTPNVTVRAGPSSRPDLRMPSENQKGFSDATCKPEEQTVEVPVLVDPHIIHNPKCIRVERCGGCCGTDILVCEATEFTEVDVPVQKYAYVAEVQKLNFLQQDYVKVQKHTKCECKCRIKAKDCSPRHVYKESECMCLCENVDEQESCANDPLKVWDHSSCTCACRESRDCSSGHLFDLQTCSCAPLPHSNRKRPRNRRNNRNRD